MPEQLVIDVFDCPRCGGRHASQAFRLLYHANSPVTHFADCERTGQPILLAWDERIMHALDAGQAVRCTPMRPRDALPVRFGERD